MQCRGRQYNALLRELKALKRRYRSTDASSVSSGEPHDLGRFRLDKLLGKALIFAQTSRLPICFTINTRTSTSVSCDSHFCTCPLCNMNMPSLQHAHAHLAICIRPSCNMHVPTLAPTLQYAYTHLAVCMCPPCNMHMPT